MPADPWTDAARMAGCFAAVAAAAGPVGWVCSRAGGTVRPGRPPWVVRSGPEVVLAFVVVGAVIPAVVSSALTAVGLYAAVYGPDAEVGPTVRMLWVGLVAAPLQFGLLAAALGQLAGPHPTRTRSAAAAVAVGVKWWLVLTPPVLVLHAGVNVVVAWLGTSAEEHPLARIGADRPAFEVALFVLQAGITAPLLEEVLFRGLLLGWLVGGRGRPAERRVWAVLAIGVAYTGLEGLTKGPGPVAFAALLLAGWAGLRTRTRKRRTIGGVYASAALFAAIHSSVWPTPIPLFALGLGLGLVAVRTNGVLAPFVVHGLFNTVSVLFVLSGGAK